MDEKTFFIITWIATITALLAILVYRASSGDWMSFRETSMAASAWCSLSAVGLVTLRWSGVQLFEE